MKKSVRFNHKFFKFIVRGGTNLYLKKKVSWRRTNKYKLDKKKGAIILCNHQTDFDPVMLATEFNRPIYFVCTDTAFTKPWLTWMMKHWFGAIPKHKGAVDVNCVKQILRVIKEKGVVGIFPEGNRNIAEFMFAIDTAIAKLIKKANVDLILYNFHGGNAVYPRFAPGPRKGLITGEIKKIVHPEEYKDMSDEDLTNLIIENLTVYDSRSEVILKTDKPAEYLERILFVCPKCGNIECISTEGEHIRCSKCGLDVIFDTTLHLKSYDEAFKYYELNEWYQFQKEYIKNMEIGDSVIFSDEGAKLFTSEVGVKRELITEGSLKLTKDSLIFYDREFDIHKIEIASYISGTKFNFTYEGKNYLVEGSERFNALKYVLMFNKLDTLMKLNKSDIYYTLD